MRASLFLAILFLTATFSGCLDGGLSESEKAANRLRGARNVPIVQIPTGWSEAALVSHSAQDHNNHALHTELSSPNFQVIGWDPLITDYYGRTAGSHLCGDAVERNGRRLSVVHSFSSDLAFIITDVTDPANPKKMGELAMEMTHVYDLALTPDQKFVLLATSPLGPATGLQIPQVPPIRATWTDACTGETRPVQGPESGLPYGAGVILVDISNPRNPIIADFRNFPILGGHSVSVHEVNGRALILSTIANLPGPANYYVFMDILSSPAGPRLNVLNVYQYRTTDPQHEAGTATFTAHDGTIQKHPITGQWIAYLAYGDWGLITLNIDDVRNPRFLGRIIPWAHVPRAGPNFAAGYIHEALPINGTWNGKHYTFLGDECSAHPPGVPTCLAYAIDTTDPAKMKMVGAWTLPHDVSWTAGLQYSLHYLGLHNQTLFVTVYHGGLWAVDVSNLSDTPRSFESVGVFMPPNISPKPPIGGGYSPRVNDLIVFPDGILVVWDAQTGVYTVRFDDQNPAPAPEPWDLGFPKAAS